MSAEVSVRQTQCGSQVGEFDLQPFTESGRDGEPHALVSCVIETGDGMLEFSQYAVPGSRRFWTGPPRSRR